MATPQDLAQFLINYWKSAALSMAQYEAIKKGGHVSAYDASVQLARAQLAMKALVAACTQDANVRIMAFARNGIFEQALLLEDGRLATIILDAARSHGLDLPSRAILSQGDPELRPPRVIMLDGIYAAGTAGLFSFKDPSGLTSWIKSVSAAGIAMSGALQGDPDPRTRTAISEIVRDCAMPVELAIYFKTSGTFESAKAQLQTSSTLPPASRAGVTGKLVEAEAAVNRRLEGGQLDMSSLPAFPVGDGSQAATLPPALAWYRRTAVRGAAIVGVVVGGALASHASATR